MLAFLCSSARTAARRLGSAAAALEVTGLGWGVGRGLGCEVGKGVGCGEGKDVGWGEGRDVG